MFTKKMTIKSKYINQLLNLLKFNPVSLKKKDIVIFFKCLTKTKKKKRNVYPSKLKLIDCVIKIPDCLNDVFK